jgi:hypothetical protein
MEFQVVASLVGNVGIGGILAWYLYYTVTVVQPRLLNEYREDLRQERIQRNGLYGTLRDLVDEMRARPCLHESLDALRVKQGEGK